MSSRPSLRLSVLVLLLSCCWPAAVLSQTTTPPPSQGTYPPLPYRQLAAYNDSLPGVPDLQPVSNVAVDNDGNIYVCEIFASTVVVLYPNHTEKTTFSVAPYATAITLDADGALYASSLFIPEIVKYSATGHVLFTYQVSSGYGNGMAVDSAGLLWVGYFGVPTLYVYNTNGSVHSTFNNYTQFIFVGINPARDTVYVTGGPNNTIDVYDTATLALVRQIPTGDIIVNYLTVTASGNLYVSTPYEVYELDSTGAIIADLSSLFGGEVLDVIVSPVTGLVYFNDYLRSQVLVLYPDTNTVDTIYRGGLPEANNAALDAQGNIYINSLAGIVVLYPNGTQKALYQTTLKMPTAVAVSPDGTIYVSSDPAVSTTTPLGYVTVFQQDGTVIGYYNYSSAAVDSNARGLAVDFATGTIYVLTAVGQIVVMSAADGTVQAVYNTSYTTIYGGIALSSAGLLYICTGANQSVAVFTTAGVQQAEYYLSDYGVQPSSITIDAAGTLYVSDVTGFTGRVIVMDGSTGAVKGQYSFPSDASVYYEGYEQLGVAVDPQGNLYIAHDTLLLKLQPAIGQQLTINLATGFTTADYSSALSTTDGALDANWRIEGQAAPVLTTNGVDFNPVWQPNGPTSDWVGLPTTADGVTAESYNFTRTFALPATLDVTTLTFTGQIVCDKSCVLYLNDQLLATGYEQAGYGSYQLEYSIFNAPTSYLVLGGVNTLTIVLSTVNTTGDDAGVQYNGVRLEGYVNAIVTPSSSVLGDPQFVGLLGQSYQVHGLDGAVYNLISDQQVQLNSRFTYLSGGECVLDAATNQPLYTCWTHPGSYLSELALVTNGGDVVRVVAGKALTGFAAVEVSSGTMEESSHTTTTVLAVGDSASMTVLDEDGIPSTATITYTTLRTLTISHAGLYSLTVQNSDGFLNILQLTVSSMQRLGTHTQSHGLIGQTWRAASAVKGSEVREVEGRVDDYAEASGDMMGCGFVYNRFQC